MKYSIVYFFLLAFFLTSCEDELDIPNPNQITNESFWQDEVDAVQGVNACYSTLHRTGFSRWQPMLYDLRSDVGTSNSPWSELANAISRFIQPDSNFGPVVDVYADNYVGIFRANQVIANVPDIDMDETLKQRVLGEAYFFRAMHYYHLASLWGNVPLQLAPSKPTDLPPNASEAEVWAQVISDLTLAAEKLPLRYVGADAGRITQGGALALLAKAYMQIGEYGAAAGAMEFFFSGAGASEYQLTADYADNFRIFTENNQESVLEWWYADNPLEFTDQDTQTPNHNFGSSLAQFYAPPGIGFTDGEALRWPIAEFTAERTIDDQRDPRLAATYLYNFTDEAGPEATLIYGTSWAERYGPDNNRVFFRKPLNDHHKNSEGFRSTNNYRFIRFADVLLMYAESLNAIGRTADAYQYVDQVRARVNLPALSETRPGMSQAEFMEQIKHERLLELTGEGHRFNDLKRWGDLGPELSDRDPGFINYQPGKHGLLPIPQRDLDINPNLVQNPNW